ncbi:ABC-F family ATP-binding cassette domain-containing protein [Caldibacillus sp. 210928-DFI.2.22]|uniref:ABC-F family ATP-binding cassette domain-containing protein n=1 Tax=Bacillaceae TaxID=186817 RepID=UPI001D069ECA|nr:MULTISPECIES: ABC-F family ATP-binding cassette domain-containing protein [Bacillaceae]MCB7069642.1 ABC-F family ATP-binding cassette domain-containing protein [Caldibacillus sp. 210928-DFI.2.22]MCB7073021.1 ABC-F family ATP-binding cassette domain-containing protein [Caldibacillus sp. 210928-DFI.2.18]MED3643602.1 ABC-F family ATP-binding cassette domain-containing protein [Caldifermentibacillus hisashii]
MILLQVNQLNKYYGADLVLSNIKLEIHTRDRIALVGRNGSGKSTLLKIIAGELAYDSGEIIKPKEVTIGFLDQHTGLVSDRTIWDEMLTVFEDLRSMEKRLRNLEQEMAKEETYTDEGKYKQILSEYDYLQHEFKELGGYQYEADIRSVLHGLNFSTFNYQETKISNLSGGQKTRLALGKLLLSKPDILILDEPTNHLDIDTLTWLEQYLQSYDGAILIVSHDRYFLDKLVNQVYECAQTTLTKYVGNYSQYLVQKAENYERDLKMYEKQQDEIARMKEFIAKNLTRASTTKRAQSRRKALERMQMIDKPHRDDKSANFSFQIERQSGNEVLNVVDLAIGYGANQISKNIHFRIQRGDSIALLGPNGVGKSTLLKTIVGQLQALSGNIHFGANVTIAYYDQEQANLTSNKRVLNELWDEYPTKTEKEIRTILGNFLFSGDDVLKTVSTLSGGEKARLSLAKLMMLNANFLILDEPTNHLDLDSKEILENALVDFPGTILFVSHDRYFINRIATKVFELSTDGVTEYLGDYDYYIEKKEEMMEIQKLSEESEHNQTQEPASDLDAKTRYEQEKELKKVERQKKRRIEEIETLIESLEMEIAEKEQQFLHPEIYSDHTKVAELNKEIEKAKAKIETLLEEWSELE